MNHSERVHQKLDELWAPSAQARARGWPDNVYDCSRLVFDQTFDEAKQGGSRGGIILPKLREKATFAYSRRDKMFAVMSRLPKPPVEALIGLARKVKLSAGDVGVFLYHKH